MALGSTEIWPNRHLTVAVRLRQRRGDLRLTQKQVVARLNRNGIQTSNRTLSSLEHGAGVDVARLPELAAALECSVTYLLGLTTDPHQWIPDVAGPAPRTERAVLVEEPREPQPTARASWILGPDVPDRALLGRGAASASIDDDVGDQRRKETPSALAASASLIVAGRPRGGGVRS